jgi:hypothetical protein
MLHLMAFRVLRDEERAPNECGTVPLGFVDGNEIRGHEENVE